MVSILAWISSVLIRNPSVPCVCQSAATSSFFIAVSSTETAGQNLFDAMNFRGHVARGDPGDLRDSRGVGPFEIKQDDLPLDRLQLPDECAQPLQRLAAIEGILRIAGSQQIVDL